MRFIRYTHNADGSLRTDIPGDLFGHLGEKEPTCDLQMLHSYRPMTIEEIYDAHKEYDKVFNGPYDAPFDYTVSDLLRGLAQLIELDVVRVIWDEKE